jgi:thiol:disulfide interchange protein DsbD
MIQWAVLWTFCMIYSLAPMPNPVQWSYSAKPLPANQYELHLVAKIPKGWHIYSQSNTSAPGPTRFEFFRHPGIKLNGTMKEVNKSIVIKDHFFQADVRGFLNKAEFMQLMERKDSLSVFIRGTVTYIACNEKNCLPPKTDSFQVELK